MTPTTKAGRALHADPITRQVASYPHPEGVTDCWLCRHIVLVEREAAAEAEALRAALTAMTVCDVCMALFWGSAWCHDQRTAQVAALATPAPATPAEPER